jgi:hypothetical protein
VAHDCPVLSIDPTPRTPLEEWSFSLAGGDATLAEWS